MKEIPIARIIESKWVGKVGKYIVKLGFVDERAKSVWMTQRQLDQLESQFARKEGLADAIRRELNASNDIKQARGEYRKWLLGEMEDSHGKAVS